jgi:hypothetical protein
VAKASAKEGQMIHRSFRSLDRSPKLVVFTARQWVGVIAGSCAVLGAAHLGHLSLKPTITLYVFLVGLPAALSYVSESGGVQIGRLLWNLCAWRVQPAVLQAVPRGFDGAPGVLVITAEAVEPARVDARLAQEPDDALARFLCEEDAG